MLAENIKVLSYEWNNMSRIMIPWQNYTNVFKNTPYVTDLIFGYCFGLAEY